MQILFNLLDMNMSLTSGTLVKYTQILVTIILILEYTSITLKSLFLLMNLPLQCRPIYYMGLLSSWLGMCVR